MEIRKKKILGNKWEIVNETWETYYSWGHKTTLIRNGYCYSPYKVRYYNRTWERYTYESCMNGAVNTLIDEEKQLFIERFKQNNGITRFKKGQKEEVIKEFEKTSIYKELKKLKKVIENRTFD